VSSLASGLTQLHGWLAYTLIAALIFGETAVFVGFVLPGEIAAVLGGVLASRGHVSLPLLIIIVVLAAIAGPFIGYEIGRRMGSRLFAAKALRRVRGGADRARSALGARGGAAVLLGRFVVVVRAVMPAAAGAAEVRYRTFAIYNVLGGLIWGTGYCLLGYLAGSAYAAVERRVGTGLAIAIGAVVVAAVAVWTIRRHRSQVRGPAAGPDAAAPEAAPDAAEFDAGEPDAAAPYAAGPDTAGPDAAAPDAADLDAADLDVAEPDAAQTDGRGPE
jgi:membrane-associated protein